MLKYGNNSPIAALRLVIMACMVERKISAKRMAFLKETAERFTLSIAHIAKVVSEYEKDVLEAQEADKKFYFGDGALPRSLVHGALDEIEHLDLRLQIAHHMALVVMQDGDHTAKEVAFVEACIGYWGIKEPWRELVKTIDEMPRRGLRMGGKIE